jgi:hypothetical protein
MVEVQLLFALVTAVQLHHQNRTHQRPQGQEVQPEIQHAAAGVRSGLAALRHHALVPSGQFFGGDSTAERGSTKAHRSCLLVGHSAPL